MELMAAQPTTVVQTISRHLLTVNVNLMILITALDHMLLLSRQQTHQTDVMREITLIKPIHQQSGNGHVMEQMGEHKTNVLPDDLLLLTVNVDLITLDHMLLSQQTHHTDVMREITLIKPIHQQSGNGHVMEQMGEHKINVLPNDLLLLTVNVNLMILITALDHMLLLLSRQQTHHPDVMREITLIKPIHQQSGNGHVMEQMGEHKTNVLPNDHQSVDLIMIQSAKNKSL
ncbi:MAG: hypothetical protein ACI870_000480 [Crocinitomicaceae bacterium]|jgi:hypothetical protein